MNRCVLGLASLLLVLSAASCGHPEVPIAAAPPPDLEMRADNEARASAPNGERLWTPLRGVSQQDGFTDWRVPLEAGQCYWFGYAGDGGVSRFSMYIWDPSDKRLDSSRGKPGQGVFSHCAKLTGMYRLQGKVNQGAGHYAVVVYKTKAPQQPVVAAPPSAPVADLAATIEKQAASAAPGAHRLGDFYAGSADTSDWYTALEPGKCYWFIGAGEPGKVKKLYIYLWDAKNRRVTESKSDSEVAMVGHCATEAGMFKFQAKVDSGSGKYKVGVYVK